MANRGFLVGAAAALGTALGTALALLASSWAGAGPAEAAFQGESGRIVYQAASILYYDLDTPVTDAEDIWSAEPDGSARENLTRTPEQYEFGPAWSPDGTRVAFARSQYEYSQRDVWAMGADGTGQVNLTDSPHLSETQPAWSLDGQKIAFVREGDVWSMRADGTGQVNLTDTPGSYERDPAFSPEGGRIAFSAGGDVWAMDADGTARESLTGPFDGGGSGSDERAPSFSPDGRTIAFTAYVESSCAQNIFAMDAGGSAWTNLTRIPDQSCSGGGGDYAGLPAYSPDGQKIAFVTGSYSDSVAVMNSDGTGQGLLDLDPDPDDDYYYYASSPDWQPVCPCPEVPPPDDTDPTVTRPRPSPSSEVRDRTPTIKAVVRDEGSELAKADITLRVDGRAKRFSYDPETDRLSRATKKLSLGRHTVEVTATDGAGNTATKKWSFRVVRR